MAYEAPDNEPLNDRERAIVRMRSISNYVMGILLLGAGCFFLFPLQRTKIYIDQYDPTVIKIFGIICCLYGIFRIYRGYKKNYFRGY